MPQLASLIPAISAGTNLASAGSGLYNNYENQKYQDTLRSYATDPAKLNAYASSFTKPLTAGLSEGVNNQSQAYAAERGLATSPALEQQIQNQAIAPYIQQNQQTGFAQALQALGLGGGANPNPQGAFSSLGTGLSGLAKLFQQSPQQIAATGTPAALTDGSVSPYIPPTDIPPFDMTGFAFGAPAEGWG